MSIKAKRIIFIILEIIGIVWNLLCLKNVIPLKYYSISIIWVFVFMLIIVFWDKKGEKSSFVGELTNNEKKYAVLSLVLSFAWLITIIACMFY